MEDDFDIKELFRIIWESKKLIFVVSMLFALVSMVISLSYPNIYSTNALLIPSDNQKSSTSSSGLGTLSTLSSFAGLNLQGQGVDTTTEGIAVLKSYKFISDFLKRHKVLVPLLAAQEWDSKSGNLILDNSIYDRESEEWVNGNPSMQEAYSLFLTKHLSVVKDFDNGLITVGVKHISPFLAKQWTDLLIEDLNTYFMRREVREAQKSIDFIENQLNNTEVTLALKNLLYILIQEQTKIIVLANGREEYLFRTLDPAFVPNKKSGPMRSIYVILSFFIGMMSTLVVIFIAYYNNASLALSMKFPWVTSKSNNISNS